MDEAAVGFFADYLPRRDVWQSRLPRAEILARLRARTDNYFNLFGKKAARSLIWGNRVSLIAQQLLTSHVPVTLKLSDDAGGTRLMVTSGLGWAPLIVLGLIALVGVMSFVGAAAAHAPLASYFASAMIIVIAWLVLVLSAWITRDPHGRLRAFVREVCEAGPSLAG